MQNTVRQVAKDAIKRLGRSARKSKTVDWAAVEAVKSAAKAAGYGEELWQWVRPGLSVTRLAEAFLARYCQAYGPIGTAIDVSQNMGVSTPVIVDLASE